MEIMIIGVTILILYVFALVIGSKMLVQEEKIERIIVISIITIISMIVTFIVYNISKHNVEYINEEIKSTISNTLVALFIGVNMLINIPLAAKMYLLNKSGKVKNSIVLIVAFILINLTIAVIEVDYMVNIQNRIINIVEDKMENS